MGRRLGGFSIRKATSLRLESLEPRHFLAADFLSFSIADASGDATATTLLESGALSVNYDFDLDGETLESIDLFAQSDGRTLKIGEYGAASAVDQLVSFQGFTDLAGTHDVFAVASLAGGSSVTSSTISLDILEASSFLGDFTADTFSYSGSSGTASVYYGSGGTDTLSFNALSSFVTSFNGVDLSALTPNSLVASAAIYNGTAFDYLTLADGSEVYLQGIEWLEFSNGQQVELQTRPNDPRFGSQWNLAIADVPDAWRFTRGSEEVLLVSIDTGIPISNGSATFADLSANRLSFEGNANGSDHWHQAVSVLAAEANNNEGIAGINWNSPVLVFDVYGPNNVGINTAINTALSYLDNTSATRVVFQGGVQGEFWLNTLQGGLISSISEEALFAVAAGNGSQDISLAFHPDGLSGGIARLEGTHDNVIAVGALIGNGLGNSNVEGQLNATSVSLASYSNFGPNLTFAAPTNVPAQLSSGSNGTFTGTSASNPVLAGYSSLVWSVNPSLTAGEVRQILAETATDVGALGRDTEFGHGVPNAGAAVRRAWALAEDNALATLTENPFSDIPELAGDYDLNGLVSAADYTVWRDTFGTQSVQYVGGDGDGSTFVDQQDYSIWSNSFGSDAPVPETYTLIDAAMGNGGFLSTTTASSDGDASTNLASGLVTNGNGRALVDSSTAGIYVDIPGWRAQRTSYSGGNAAFGFDGDSNRTVGSEPAQYAFVNAGAMTLTSDLIQGTFSEGSVFDLSFLAEATTGPGDVTATITFNNGESHTFSTVSGIGTSTVSFADSYTLMGDATGVQIRLLMETGDSGAPQLKLDGVSLDITTIGDPLAGAAFAAATTADLPGTALESQEESGFEALGRDSFPTLQSSASALFLAASPDFSFTATQAAAPPNALEPSGAAYDSALENLLLVDDAIHSFDDQDADEEDFLNGRQEESRVAEPASGAISEEVVWQTL